MSGTPRKRTPVSFTEDRNFDDLAPRFARNIYGGLKGQLRLAVLRRDFSCVAPDWLAPAPLDTGPGAPRRVLDAGGGQGQFSLPLAAAGHALTLCDLSAGMLDLARTAAVEAGVSNVEFRHASIQEIAGQCDEGLCAPFDLVICHSVLEWVVDQAGLIAALGQLLVPGGLLSLTFYNRHGLVMKNLLRGRRPPILDDRFVPSAGSLTPTRPLDPQDVLRWLGHTADRETQEWDLLHRSGIRVFHDLLLTEEGRAMDEKELLALELELSLQEPYLSLGRYQHILARKR